MAKVALVTGGTRGIGRAISERLKADGFAVAANFAGNVDAARQCEEELGIKCYKFDVASFESTQEGLKQIESELGPVDVVVNNAGITRDAPFHKMTLEQWNEIGRAHV